MPPLCVRVLLRTRVARLVGCFSNFRGFCSLALLYSTRALIAATDGLHSSKLNYLIVVEVHHVLIAIFGGGCPQCGCSGCKFGFLV